MLVLYFLILGVLFLGLGVFNSFLNGDRDFDRGFLALVTPSALLGAAITSVATESTVPLLVATFIAVVGGAACAWGRYGNKLYTPPTWEDIKEVEKDPLEEIRAQLAKAVAAQAKAEARARNIEERLASLEAKAETPEPAEMLQDAVEMQEIFGSLPDHPADMPHPQWVQEPASA